MRNNKGYKVLKVLILLVVVQIVIMIKVQGNEYVKKDIGVTYSCHVQDVGWQGWRNDGELAGTEGQSKRLEAIKFRLENVPEKIKIKYIN